MSYELCKRITLDKKNNKIKLCIASNNVRPLDYHTCEICDSKNERFKDYTFDDKLLALYEDLQNGSVQISTMNSNTEKFVYAETKARQWLRENNIDSYEDLYCRKHKEYYATLSSFIDKKIEDETQYKNWVDTVGRDYAKSIDDEVERLLTRKIYGKPFEIFKKALFEEIEGSYKIKCNDYYLLYKLGRYDRGFSKYWLVGENSNNFEVMSYKKAFCVINDLQSKSNHLEMIRVDER